MTKLHPKPIRKKNFQHQPFVSVIIAAKNEALNIEKRINNILKQDYPADKIEIIVVSDGSDDETRLKVQQLATQQKKDKARVFCHEYFPSQGKSSAVNFGVQQASAEFIVFADSRQTFKKNVITELIKNFTDPTIGGVSGELIFQKEGESSIKVQMGAYWKYEKQIRKMESKTGSVVGATGAIYAVRKELYTPLHPATLLDDVMTPMNIVAQGYRVIFDPCAIAYDVLSKNTDQEWNRKVRTLAGNWQLLSLNKSLLLPHKNPLWFRFISHKLTRVFVPFFLILLLITSSLTKGIFFQLTTIIQIIVYLTALIAFTFPATRNYNLVQASYFFCVMNFAAIKGFWIWASGNCTKIWLPTQKLS